MTVLNLLKWSASLLLFSILGLVALVFFYVKSSGVERLVYEFPHFDRSTDSYYLSSHRPDSWVPYHQVSHHAKWAIIVSEDWTFFEHKGIDLEQLKIVLEESWQEKEFTRGASTITQQVIKNVFLSDERTVLRKAKEMLLALHLERVLDKEKILEIYFNIVHLGREIYGIRDASLYYFQVQPWDLSAKQGAFLAMLLPSPDRYSVSYRRKELSSFAQEQVSSILLKLRQAKILTEEQRLEAQAEDFLWDIADLYMP